MQRRDFVVGAVTMSAAAGLSESSKSEAAARRHWDLVIVGAGTAGLPAAIFASRRGARVLLIDSADKIGGTLHLANGQVSAAGSRTQAAKGIWDSADRHFDDVMRLTHGRADPALIRLTVDRAPQTINWLLDRGLQPLPDHPTTGDAPGRPAYTIARYIWGKNEGRDILAVVLKELQPELDSGRVVTQLNSRAVGILTDAQGAVVGVRVLTPEGEREFRGRHILLTTGGYAMNPEAFLRHCGYPAYAAGSYPSCRGEGLDLATAIGAQLRGNDLHRAGTGSILTAPQFPAKVYKRFITVPQERLPWEIWVNARGERFFREDDPGTYRREQALLTLGDLRYAIVFDQVIFDESPVGIPGFTRAQMREHFDTHPMFARADSLAALADKLKIDANGLTATVARYNRSVDRWRDDDFGREYLPRRIEKAPFYGVIHQGHSATSSVGLVVDAQLRVLDASRKPIPNLYAAGEVLGSGVYLGNAFCPGMMLTPALALGHWLGETLPLGRSRA
jgi:fumarate reductase flavoprotein subunit